MRIFLTYTIVALLVCHHFKPTRDICKLDVDFYVVVETSLHFSISSFIWDLFVVYVSLLATCTGSAGLTSINMEI